MIEIDFLPVGDKTDTGDAILCHFTDPGTATERVMLIDGGFHETSAAIGAHVRRYYAASRIDLMVCTHPDDDHINGLFGVFEELEVTKLVIHQPSSHGYPTDDVKAGKVDELIDLARSHGTEVITAAYTGLSFFSGALVVAGPTEEFYEELLAGEKDPSTKANRLLHAITAAAKAVKSALSLGCCVNFGQRS
ncbi:glyoxylase-like metal-dependent hydrolase (beta-lactamase superfamily II) [Arthrobacter sp. CAN_A212]|uniref:MBL fold metallo-hydrolase n=1 Tax=Arthrobacter sp. CAN_A212 TaxID=2787719 RepID=UPI0018CBE5EF